MGILHCVQNDIVGDGFRSPVILRERSESKDLLLKMGILRYAQNENIDVTIPS